MASKLIWRERFTPATFARKLRDWEAVGYREVSAPNLMRAWEADGYEILVEQESPRRIVAHCWGPLEAPFPVFTKPSEMNASGTTGLRSVDALRDGTAPRTSGAKGGA